MLLFQDEKLIVFMILSSRLQEGLIKDVKFTNLMIFSRCQEDF